MEKLVKIQIYDCLTKKVVEIEVTEEVATCYDRTRWNLEDNDQSFRAHQTCFSNLIGGEDDGYENFDEFKRKSVNPLEAIDEAISEAEKEERIARLPEAIESLKPEHRDVIEALFFKGMTQQEYAKESGIPQKTVSNRKIAALKILKKFFEKHG